MNAAARTLAQGNIFRGDFSFFSGDTRSYLISLLWIAVIASALAIVYVKNEERQYVSQISQVRKQIQSMETQTSQLMLEQSMWAAPERIERHARQNLKMKIAAPAALITVN